MKNYEKRFFSLSLKSNCLFLSLSLSSSTNRDNFFSGSLFSFHQARKGGKIFSFSLFLLFALLTDEGKKYINLDS